MSRVAIATDAIDVGAIVDEVRGSGHGAIATFLGSVRDHSDGRAVLSYAFRPEAG